MKIKKFDNFINENKYTISEDELDELDFLDSSDIRQAIKIANKEPEIGWWVNVRGEYGDVWHKVTNIYIDEENMKWSSIDYWTHRRLNGMNEPTTHIEKIVRLSKVRDILPELPEEAHIVYDENGKRYV